jgi:hypothetical protein
LFTMCNLLYVKIERSFPVFLFKKKQYRYRIGYKKKF